MNTSKQVNTIIGLLMVGAIATLLYYLWDGERETAARDRQLTENAERGGALFSLNCRACHGLNGLGSLESTKLPGARLNTDDNREADGARQDYLRATITCGRVGTQMPPWSTRYGGPLNDFQIEQLVALITGTMNDPDGNEAFEQDPAASLEGWVKSVEVSNYDHLYGDEFVPPKHLEEAISDEAETLVLNNARGLRPGNLLRLDDDPEVEGYEVVEVLDAPAGSVLEVKVDKAATELTLQEVAVFEPGDLIIVGNEQMEVVAAPALGILTAAASADATELELEDAEGFESGETIFLRREKMTVRSVSGDTLTVERGVDDTTAGEYAEGTLVTEDGKTLTVERAAGGTSAASHDVTVPVYEIGDEVIVERGAFGTDAAEHEALAEVFKGPILPSDAITGKDVDYPPCGQSPAQESGGGAEVTVEGSADVTMGDNVFNAGDNQNPTFKVAAGSTVTFNLSNGGNAVHNMVIAGPDNEFDTDDDIISDPEIISGGESGTLEFASADAGEFDYRCQFHAEQMKGTISVE